MPVLNQRYLQKIIWPAGVVVLTLAVAGLIFKSYLVHPNQHMYAFGGDALTIYYDMIYHVCFDHGTTFQGMNYPYGEYIFLTDAQGAFSTVLQWINHHVFYIGDSIPGIVHSLNLFFLPVCSLMVFYILRYYDVRQWLALVFAVLITFLSPAMLRFGAHYGLAYPFVIPMSMLWFLRKYKTGKMEWRDGLVLAVLVFFTFNNPYIGFSSSGFLACTGLIMLFAGIKIHDFFRKGLIVGGLGLLAALIPFLVFHFNDPVSDRGQQQWGFFFYNVKFKGLFFPPLSILQQILSYLKIPTKAIDIENCINLGIVSMVFLLATAMIGAAGFFRKTKWTGWIMFSRENMIMTGGATLMLIYAANRSILDISQTWVENHLGPLLMFKASGRLGWSFYFAVAISGVLFLDRALKKIKSPVLIIALVLVPVAAWTYEIKSYVGSHYQNCFHDNFFKRSSQQEILTMLKDNHIDVSTFQAMLVLPKMMAWTDHFISDLNWAAQFFSMRISAATGLPMISAMLSRMSIGQSAEAIQLLSHPLVTRDLIPKLPNQKDLLLLVGGEHRQLTPGEQYLIDISAPLYLSKDFSLYRLTIDTLQHSEAIAEAQNLYRQHPALSKDVVHLSFDNDTSDVSFFGAGAKYVYRGQTILVDRSLPVEKDTQYVFSAWNRIDNQKPGVGFWHLVIQDSVGQSIKDTIIETRRSNDIQDLWIRSEATFKAPKGCRIQATIDTNKDLYVDEVLLYPLHATTIVDLPGSKEFLFNGYKVKKPKE